MIYCFLKDAICLLKIRKDIFSKAKTNSCFPNVLRNQLLFIGWTQKALYSTATCLYYYFGWFGFNSFQLKQIIPLGSSSVIHPVIASSFFFFFSFSFLFLNVFIIYFSSMSALWSTWELMLVERKWDFSAMKSRTLDLKVVGKFKWIWLGWSLPLFSASSYL